APRADELVVRGHTYDKFLGTPLDLALRSRDIRSLIVTGILTDVCVNCTLLAAANRDYRVTAVTAGVATLWPELQQACFTATRPGQCEGGGRPGRARPGRGSRAPQNPQGPAPPRAAPA